jgi:aspartate racemase
MLGVIGGMGPLATADFFHKLLAATPAHNDADHIPVLIQSIPQIPSRPAAILRGGRSPLPALIEARDRLVAAGATVLAMPCNTAHHWADGLTRDSHVPLIHIVDAVADCIADDVATIGLIATEATLAAGIYDRRLAARGLRVVSPGRDDYANAVQPSIDAVKRNACADAGRLLEPVVAKLLDAGAQVVVLACTETPLALDSIASPLRAQCIDSTQALALACVHEWQRSAR